jgi:hypothetical protein
MTRGRRILFLGIFLFLSLNFICATTTLVSPVNGGNYSTTLAFNCTTDLGNATRAYLLYNASGGPANNISYNLTYMSNTTAGVFYNSSVSISSLTDLRTYNLSCLVINGTGTQNETSSKIMTIDNTAPTASYSCNPNYGTASARIQCSCTPSDATSGINWGTWTYTSKPSVGSIGTFTLSCSYADYAGNIGITTTSYKISPTPDGGAALPSSTSSKTTTTTTSKTTTTPATATTPAKTTTTTTTTTPVATATTPAKTTTTTTTPSKTTTPVATVTTPSKTTTTTPAKTTTTKSSKSLEETGAAIGSFVTSGTGIATLVVIIFLAIGIIVFRKNIKIKKK